MIKLSAKNIQNIQIFWKVCAQNDKTASGTINYLV